MVKSHAKTILFMIVIVLLSECGPAAAPASPTLTVAPPSPTEAPPTATPVPPTGTPVPPTNTATPSPTVTPMPTATATPIPTATQASAVTLYPEPGIRIDIRTYGERYNDWAYDILLLDDGGTLIVGHADNTGVSHRITPGKARLIRTDAEGNVIWQKDYGGEVDSMFYSPIQVGDDEYVILGQIAASYTRDEEDIYLVKIDGEGNELWSHTYVGQGMDTGKMVRQTADGGFIIVGDRADAYPRDGLYQSDFVLIKTDTEGNEVWTQTYGDKILYVGWDVAQTPDGGYILAGWEAKTIPDRDVIAIKTDAVGEVEWTRTWDLDPGDRDGGFDMILTSDGYAVIAGIKSMDSGRRGAILIKVDLEGNEVWVKEYDAGGEGSEFWDVLEDTDGGYVMAGGKYLTPLNPRTGEAVREGFIIKTDPDGAVLWQHTISSSEYQSTLLSSAVVLPGHGYIFVGVATLSGQRYGDMLWLKLASDDAPLSATDIPVLGTISANTAGQVKLLSTISEQYEKVYALDFSGDNAHLAFHSADKEVKIWDIRNQQPVYTFNTSIAVFNDIAFSPVGNLFVSADTLWDVQNWQVVQRFEGEHSAATFSPDGSLLAIAPAGKPIVLWDIASEQVVHTFDDPVENLFRSLIFSPDGTLLAAGSNNNIIRLWDVVGGDLTHTIQHDARGQPSDHILNLAFSPDGRVLASSGTDLMVRLWDVETWQVIYKLYIGDAPTGLAFSPDGTILASSGPTLRLWDVESGKLLYTLPHRTVIAVTFSPDGTLIASGGYDRKVYLWGIP